MHMYIYVYMIKIQEKKMLENVKWKYLKWFYKKQKSIKGRNKIKKKKKKQYYVGIFTDPNTGV